MGDRFSAQRGTYRIIYRIDDKNQVVTVVDAAIAATSIARRSTVRTLPNTLQDF
jgi:mRNA-degrading endonuclease RelE of RelBE toxin-antitoxin system